jgi:pimeloyl-ACP methyl ester carboxylesterase
MEPHDDDLMTFEAQGAPPLPVSDAQGYVANAGARVWYASFGRGPCVLLLHGGLGHSGNWGHQVPALLAAGYRTVVVDSRGHGRSTRDERPYTYHLMASDALAVLDALDIDKTAVVGWSDGACTALILAMTGQSRVSGVYFFACNMDPSGTKTIDQSNPLIGRCFRRHAKDYAALSPTPDAFNDFVSAVQWMMKTEPNCAAQELAAIGVPVAIVQAEHDEFIKAEHAEYLARTIPDAELVLLPGVSHFAPLQRPAQFNHEMTQFLRKLYAN